jgi:hypothetical protein
LKKRNEKAQGTRPVRPGHPGGLKAQAKVQGTRPARPNIRKENSISCGCSGGHKNKAQGARLKKEPRFKSQDSRIERQVPRYKNRDNFFSSVSQKQQKEETPHWGFFFYY